MGDNVSNNNTMIKCIGRSLEKFPGPANQTQCFAHTINLITKSILKPFDTQKAENTQAFEDALAEIREQVKGDDKKEGGEDEEEEGEEEEEEGEDDDNDNDKLAARLEPIRSMLLKV